MKEQALKEAFIELHERAGPFEGKEMVMFYLMKEILTYDSRYEGIYECHNCKAMKEFIAR